MEYRELQVDGVASPVSRLAFGSEPLGGADWGAVDTNEVEAALDVAVRLGWNFIDTAGIYGLGASEQRLGVLRDRLPEGTLIASKVGMLQQPLAPGESRATVLRTLDPKHLDLQLSESLLRLRLERLPLVYLHHPDETVDFCDVVKKVKGWIDSGLVGGYGLSNFRLHEIKKFHKHLPVSALQFECSLLDGGRSTEVRETVAWCRKNKVLSVAYGSLKKGLLTGKFGPTRPRFAAGDRRSRLPVFCGAEYSSAVSVVETLRREFETQNRPVSALAIRFVLDVLEIDVAVVGVKTVSQAVENNKCMGFELTGGEVSRLSRLAGWEF